VIVGEATRDAGPVSLIGLVALVWGASRFVVAFQDAIARVMGGDRRRGIVIENLGAFGVVLLLIAALLVSTILAGLAAFLEAGQNAGVVAVIGSVFAILIGVLPLIAGIVAIGLVYRIVPVSAPAWRAIVWPAVVVGVALTVLGRIFVFLAPRLIGSAALLGTLATVFAALAWLALSFQAVLIGAAWVRDRADRRLPAGAVTINTGSS
jgi:uncharacterized BrkB/YihY/UPF0761 family membrane protein